MPRDDNPADKSDTRAGSGDEDSTNLIKRLIDNQPLTDSHEIPDEHRREHRQYGMHTVDSAAASEDARHEPGGSDD